MCDDNMAAKPEPVKKKVVQSVKWSADHINTFLEVYMNYEILWNTRNPNYANQSKRLSAMLKLQEDLIGVGIAVPDLTFLRARIKTTKTTYRNELSKVNDSKRSGAGLDDVYVPKLMWFNTADSFLRDFAITRNSKSNLDTQTSTTDDDRMDETMVDPETEELDLEENVYDHADEDTTKTITASTGQNPPNKKRRLTKLAKVESAIDKLQKITDNRQSASSNVQADEADVFGKYVAANLKALPLKNRLICQERIHSLLTKERLALLTSPEPQRSPLVSGSSSHMTFTDDDSYSSDGQLVYRNLF